MKKFINVVKAEPDEGTNLNNMLLSKWFGPLDNYPGKKHVSIEPIDDDWQNGLVNKPLD